MEEEKKYTYKPEDIEIYRLIALAPKFFEKFIKENGRLENKEILTLVKRLEGISEESYLSLDAEDFVKKMDRTPNRVYEEFINKYGDEE